MLAGSIMLAVGIYPYLQVTSEIASNIPRIFLGLVTLGNIFVFWFMVLMAYAVGFFGVPWPDRVVKSRLIKWILRGPVTVFVVLSLMTATNEAGNYFGYPDTIALPIITVTAVLLMEHLITLIFPFIEQLFFSGGERSNLQLLNKISERLITTSDLRQFLEAVLASACDKFQVSTAFVAAIDEEVLELVVQVGDRKMLNQTGLDKVLVEKALNQNQNGVNELFSWGEFWLYPLFSVQQGSMLGLLGIQKLEEHQLEDGLAETLGFLGQRAALALEDRRLQTKMFDVLETLSPKVDMIQKLRAASRYDQTGMLNEIESSGGQIKSLGLWVKDALSHYWGGPKLTESPLLGLNVVQRALKEHNNNPANALRAILKEGIEHIRPEGERRFTAEWILYNILEMKFMEGRKVREIALRLAMSEADLYRKQRVAIEAVSKAIVDMERVARAN